MKSSSTAHTTGQRPRRGRSRWKKSQSVVENNNAMTLFLPPARDAEFDRLSSTLTDKGRVAWQLLRAVYYSCIFMPHSSLTVGVANGRVLSLKLAI